MRTTLEGLLPSTIVSRTTVLILLQALLVGLLFGAVALVLLERAETRRQEDRLNRLLATVQSTVQIACFVKDQALAAEIGSGLAHNETVVGVRILADGATLHAQGEAIGDRALDPDLQAFRRVVHSPFDPSQRVGEIVIYASQRLMRAQAHRYAVLIMVLIGLLVVLIGIAVAAVVSLLITRPIRQISDELHTLQIKSGMSLHKPLYNATGEIGRLVDDANSLIRELTALADTEHELRLEHEASEQRLSLIFEKVDAGLFELGDDGSLVSWNPAFVRTLGEPGDSPRLRDLIPEHAAAIEEATAASFAAGQPHEIELEINAPEASTRWVELSLTRVAQHRLQGVINDVTEHKHIELAAQQRAERDTLTGLLNRRGLEAGLSAAFESRLNGARQPLTVMMIDLDYFKQVNDRYGHAAGDQVLRHVAGIFRQAVRSGDLVARPGGDEFEILLMGIEDIAKAESIARQIIERVAQPIDIGGGNVVRVGASIGLAMVAPGERHGAPAQLRADEALYAVKAAGRGHARVAPLPENPAVAPGQGDGDPDSPSPGHDPDAPPDDAPSQDRAR